MRINHNDVLNTTLVGLERLWRARPLVILACAGFADEHWQIYNPHEFRTNDEPMPLVTIDLEGHVVFHDPHTLLMTEPK